MSINSLYKDLQNKVIKKQNNTQDFGNLGAQMYAKANANAKMDFSEYTPYASSDVYKTFSDGTKIAKYENYIPGTDNNERFAQGQDTWDKWSNGLLKAGANLGTTIVGNTVGLVYGAANGIQEGSFNAVFDNNFSNGLADLNEKLGYKLPNYVKKDMQDAGFFDSLTGDTSNFIANDVMGALSFTLGTAVSEAIWATATGGTSLLSSPLRAANAAAKAGRAMNWGKEALGLGNSIKALAKSKSIVDDFTKKIFTTKSIDNILEEGTKAGTRNKWLNTSRFLTTTSGNEAGIESSHYKREARENFYENFAKLNNREPTQSEISEFEEKNNNAANAVFASNMAILAPSNLVVYGSLFKINNPFKDLTKTFNKGAFGVGVEKVAEGGYEAIKASKKQLGARWGYAIAKDLGTEAVWEEGLQGVTSKSAENWISSIYNPKYNNKTLSLIDATTKAFAEQYGTKQGWKEIGIGAIVGGGFSMIKGRGKLETVRELEQEAEYQGNYIKEGLNQFGDMSTVAMHNLSQRIMMQARMGSSDEDLTEAIKNKDSVRAKLAMDSKILEHLQFNKNVGNDLKELPSLVETALNAESPQTWEELGISDIESYKKNVLASYSDLISSFEKATDFADAIIGDSSLMGDVKTMNGQKASNQQLKEALTYSIVSGQSANKAMDTILQDYSKILGEDSVKALNVQKEVQRVGKNKQAQVTRLNKIISQKDNEVKTLSAELQKLQLSKDENKGSRLQAVQEKLTEATANLSVLKEEREEIAKSVSQESKRRRGIDANNVQDFNLDTDVITGEDLANIDEKMAKIEETIKSYQGVNHELYYDLIELQAQYKSANQKFLDYQESIDAIVTGKFQPKFAKVEGLMGKVFNAGTQPMDDFTTTFLQDIYSKYINSITGSGVDNALIAKGVNDEQYKIFKETGEISQEVKDKIADKVKAKEVLDSREKEVYETIKQEINEDIKPNPNKPSLTVDTKAPTQPKTDIEVLRETVEKAFEKSYPLLTEDIDELIRDRPTLQDAERYKELYAKKDALDLFESQEFDELQKRMQKWFMVQSLPVGEASIADLIEILAQIETQIEQDETVVEPDVEELFRDVNDAKEVNRTDILQNRAGSVVAKIINDEIHIIHALAKGKDGQLGVIDKLVQFYKGIANMFVKVGLKGEQQLLTPEIIEKGIKETGTEFEIGEVKFTIGERGNLVFDYTQFKDLASDILNMYYFDAKAGTWSYIDVYEVVDGQKVKMQSQYGANTQSDAIYELEEGSDLELFVDMNIQWNYDLKIKALQEVNEDGKISEETRKEIFNSLEITSRKDKVNNSTLKATKSETVNDEFLLIRKRFADEFIRVIEEEQALATLPKKLELDIEVPVKEIHLGTPDFILDANNKPIDLPITARGAEEVITQGYYKGTEITLADKSIDVESISRIYVKNSTKQDPNVKVPVVILKKGKHTFAFPLSLIRTQESQADKLDEILAKDLTPIQGIKEINNLLISIGSNTRISGVSPADLDAIRVELENYTSHVSADQLASDEYDKANLVKDAQIKIDLEQRLISSPKITVDYSQAMIGKFQENETNAAELRKTIVNDIIEIRNIVNSSVGIPEQNRFVEAFDNEDVENKPDVDILNRKDINFMKKVFFYANGNRIPIQGTASEIIGKDKLHNLREKLERLEFYEMQVKIAKDKITAKKISC